VRSSGIIHEVSSLEFADGVRAGAKRLGRKKELSEVKKAANIEHQLSARK
jgi:hypothetical protein